MDSSCDADMTMDELFDGWLSAPSMASFLIEEASPAPLQPSEHQRYNSPVRSDIIKLLPRRSQLNTAARQRRSHTKSRFGCIGCKERKIKCQETWPSCTNCKKRGIPCRYPTAVKTKNHGPNISKIIDTSIRTVRLSDKPTYSPNDMYLFHHFLVSAYPWVPHDYEDIWTKEMPRFSHNYGYLMHAMLALSASHLASFSDEDTSNGIALLHRHKAIVGLEDAITRWPTAPEETHIMLATSYLLTFQSSYLSDGFLEHLHFLRGCAVLSRLILDHRLEGAFSVSPNIYNPTLTLMFKNCPHVDQELVYSGLRSMEAFAHILVSPTEHDIERALVAQFVETFRQLLEQDHEPNDIIPDPTENGTHPMSTPDTPSSTSNTNSVVRSPLLASPPATAFEDISWDTVASYSPPDAPSPARSFNALMACLMILSTWPSNALLRLFSLTNPASNVVMCHYFAVRCIVTPLYAPKSVLNTPARAFIEWWGKIIDAVHDDEERSWTQYVQWPSKIHRSMQLSLQKKKGLNFSDIYDIVVNDPAALKEGRAKKVPVR